jgi:hypothetical protein
MHMREEGEAGQLVVLQDLLAPGYRLGLRDGSIGDHGPVRGRAIGRDVVSFGKERRREEGGMVFEECIQLDRGIVLGRS